MNVAFYSPIKPPDHPVPSGDRTMANNLIAALQSAGHSVTLASRLRSYSSTPDHTQIQASAALEAQNLISIWSGDNAAGKPDVWFTYHPYYKAPDLIGPVVSGALNIPYMTAEASYSSRRQSGEWAASQTHVIEAVRQADINFCMTSIDREGLNHIVDHEKLSDLPAFIDTSTYHAPMTRRTPGHSCRLVTVAMMRRGVKFDSYELLAAALRKVDHEDWSLAIIGDGSAREDVIKLFDGIDTNRIDWLGQLSSDDVRKHLAQSDIFVWPGFGEAYGLAYLEAQALGLPVIAQDTHGVPSVVCDGITGLLTPPGDVIAFAKAIDQLATREELRTRMSEQAHRFVHQERNLTVASFILNQAIVRARRGQQQVGYITMTDWREIFAPVRDELDAWESAGKRAELWLRDDDAVAPTEALARLVSISGAANVPLLLCVVPEATSDALHAVLDAEHHVCVAVHGFGHHNHAPAGEKAQELGPHRPVMDVVSELERARAKLHDLYGKRLSSILVPPWNRISHEVVAHLPQLGFSGISTFGSAHEADGIANLVQLNTHLDIIDWKGTRGGRDPRWLANELAKLLRQSRIDGASPIGVLAHHLVHDELAWAFLEELFKLTVQHRAADWWKADALIAQSRAG